MADQRADFKIEANSIRVFIVGGPYDGKIEIGYIVLKPGEGLAAAHRTAAAEALDRLKSKYNLPDLNDPWPSHD
jgi:hypothetical protein